MSQLGVCYFAVAGRPVQDVCATRGANGLIYYGRKHDFGCSQSPSFAEPSGWWEPRRTIRGVCTCVWPFSTVAVESGTHFYRRVPSDPTPPKIEPRPPWQWYWRTWRRALRWPWFRRECIFHWVFFDLPDAGLAADGEMIALRATRCGALAAPKGMKPRDFPAFEAKCVAMMTW